MGAMMLLASRTHTAGDTKRWSVSYDRWLDNTAEIETIDIQSSSTTCTVNAPQILGHDVIFFLTGGTLNERVTLTLTMTDDLGNVKHDTIAFTVVAP
jgi:hypothetical protein